jgi:hypothetical protein
MLSILVSNGAIFAVTALARCGSLRLRRTCHGAHCADGYRGKLVLTECGRHPAEAVILDLDCVLLDSQQMWSAVRERLTRKQGGHWAANAHAKMCA